MGALSIAELSSSSSSSDSDREECVLEEEVAAAVVPDARLVSSVRALLHGLGEDSSRNGLIKTPLRVANAFLSATKGYKLSAEETIGGALFAEAGPGNGKGGGCGGMVIVKNIDLFSTCESCLLPFKLCCHIAYIPSQNRVVGLSKLPRVADIFAARLQSPDRLVGEIATALMDGFKPLGVAVVAEGWHLDCPSDLNLSLEPASWVRRSVSARKGTFDEDPHSEDCWNEFVTMLQVSGISQLWKKSAACPMPLRDFAERVAAEANLDTMVEAVTTLLRELGEDLSREELKFTPLRYVRWLLASTQGSRLSKDYILGNSVADLTDDGESREDDAMRAVLGLRFCSLCEHHLLPFSGVAHVGVLPATTPSSRPKATRAILERIIKLYSCRLQVQERLTRQIAEGVMSTCAVNGVMVVVEASHICMISRGVKKSGSSTATLATLGEFDKQRGEFLREIAAANSST